MLTIGITTFKYRYEKYFLPLMESLYDGTEIIIAINGEHKENFDDNYRQNILNYISTCPNSFPIIFPQFRGLSKLWNSIILNATEDYILLLNDDVTINADNFIQHVKACINEYQTSFQINGSFSHVVLKRSEVADVGYFDERLLGIGEEEIFIWEYENLYNRKFINLNIPGIINHVDMSHAPTNIIAGNSGKYSKFNRDLLFNELYKIDYKNGKVFGKINEPLIVLESKKEQYPYEKFYKENKEKL